ncbi:TetR/AcrR family transcriptional regulator [Amycolatopsis nigrescens]|uniref:TetR/AcrR family transcriptional regulator n=1 Tax=Amycolatopsis nigrescens TaxID=381445 RepID=UPI0003705F02|nr:TetR/AcrR family transcriptional regulator [Amycolatopsis nigrescens]
MAEQRGPVKTRRRGQELLDAIYQAVLAELAEAGFRGLTMDGIAERAGTGRMPLYRRWSRSEDLVLDALEHALASTTAPADTGDLRADLLGHFRQLTEQLLAGTLGRALGAVIGERGRYPELVDAIRDRLLQPRQEAMTATLLAAAARGEIEESVVTPEICAAGPALIVVHNLINGSPPTGPELEAIVDNVVLPALRFRG